MSNIGLPIQVYRDERSLWLSSSLNWKLKLNVILKKTEVLYLAKIFLLADWRSLVFPHVWSSYCFMKKEEGTETWVSCSLLFLKIKMPKKLWNNTSIIYFERLTFLLYMGLSSLCQVSNFFIIQPRIEISKNIRSLALIEKLISG